MVSTLSYVLLAMLFGVALLGIWWMVRYKEPDQLWIGVIRTVTAIVVLAIATNVLYAVLKDDTLNNPAAALALQVAKDAPGLMLVAVLVAQVRRTNVSVLNRPATIDGALGACPVVFAAAVLLSLFIGAMGGQQYQLEAGPGVYAAAYRLILFGPLVAYSLLLSYLISEDAKILGRVEPSLKPRYYLFSIGALTWALLALDHICRPTVFAVLGFSLEGGLARLADTSVAVLWLTMAVCWVYGYAAKPGRNTRTDHAIAATNTYRITSTNMVARLEDTKAVWLKRIPNWQRRKAELTETIKECCRDHDRSKKETYYQIQTGKRALDLLAMLAHEPSKHKARTAQQIQTFRLAYERHIDSIPRDSPARQHMLADPVAVAAKDVLHLNSEDELCLRSTQEWVQVTALLCAEMNLLPLEKTARLLDPQTHTLDQDVYQALKDVRFMFRFYKFGFHQDIRN